MNIYDQLQALNITLPSVAVPAAAYVPFVQTGKLVLLSGHIAKQDGKPWVGQLGSDMTTEQAKAAARAVAIDLIGTLHAAAQAAGTDLNGVKRIVKVLSHRAPPGHQRLQRAVGPGFWPAGGRARTQRLWRGTTAVWRVR